MERVDALKQVLHYHEQSEYQSRALDMYVRLIQEKKEQLIAKITTQGNHEPFTQWIEAIKPQTTATARATIQRDWFIQLRCPESQQLFSDLCTLITEVERITAETAADMAKTIKLAMLYHTIFNITIVQENKRIAAS